MSTRWDHTDFWPELDYARPPRRPVDWRLTIGRLAIAIAVLAVWTIIGLLAWTHWPA